MFLYSTVSTLNPIVGIVVTTEIIQKIRNSITNNYYNVSCFVDGDNVESFIMDVGQT
jgi:hypothetical protein